jgi:putative membrane protein
MSLFVAAVVAMGAAPQANMKDGTAKMAGSPDEKFVMEAAEGGMMEVQLGQVAVAKATSADVKQFGQRMIDDHSKANDELTGLASSKGITLPTALDAKHQAEVDRLSKLSGADFDRHYMMMMVEDHNKDVAAFDRESKSGKDPDVKAWAAKTLPTLKEHQTMAKDVAAKVGHADMKHGM